MNGVTGAVAVLILMTLVAAGIDAIVFGGAVAAGIRAHVRPAAARWERGWPEHRFRP